MLPSCSLPSYLEKPLSQKKEPRVHLTLTGLLREGIYTQNHT